jgi:hypothetical protein
VTGFPEFPNIYLLHFMTRGHTILHSAQGRYPRLLLYTSVPPPRGGWCYIYKGHPNFVHLSTSHLA